MRFIGLSALTLTLALGCGSSTSSRDASVNDASANDASPDDPDAGPDTPDGGPVFDTEPNVAFVTSTVQNGDLGGLAGADALCAERASAAGLSGTFVAWLSTSTVNAKDRLGTARGWVRTDGVAFADTVDDIVAGAIYHPLRFDENGDDLGPNNDDWAFTGTAMYGTYETDYSCDDWTSSASQQGTSGHPTGTSGAWTDFGSASCSGDYHIYCFQTDYTTPISMPPPAGRRAFFTSATWTPGGGISDADALCQSEADDAGLTGTFLALLATSSASALSRFTIGAGWTRTDGVHWSNFAETTLNVELGGDYIPNSGVWGGAQGPLATGTLASTCDDWTTTTRTTGVIGRSGLSGQDAFSLENDRDCAATNIYLYCLQE